MEKTTVSMHRGRLGIGAFLAAALTLALSLFAAFAGPYPGRFVEPSPTVRPEVGGARAVPLVPTRPAAAATPTAPPRLQLFGPPINERLLVETRGVYRYLDAATGTLGPELPGSAWPSRLYPISTGFACVCATVWREADGETAELTVRLTDPSGVPLREIRLGSLRGFDDPALSADSQGGAVAWSARVSADERAVYLGISVRGRKAWGRAVWSVDLERGRVTARTALPSVALTRPVGAASAADSAVATPRVVPSFAHAWAPEVQLSPSGRNAVVSANVVVANQTESFEQWRATITGRDLRKLTPFVTGTGALPTLCPVTGFATEESYFSLCSWDERPRFVLAARDGSVLSEASLGPVDAPSGLVAHVLDRRNGRVFVWNATSRALARVDLRTGVLDGTAIFPEKPPGGTGALPASPASLLAAVGHALSVWVAPVTAAKVMIEPVVLLSPDGQRLYALGWGAPHSAPNWEDPAGVYVIDSGNLQLVDAWPAAKGAVTSLAFSRDGSVVFVAGLSPRTAVATATSVTAFDARTGKVRMIAGDLGEEWLVLRGGGG